VHAIYLLQFNLGTFILNIDSKILTEEVHDMQLIESLKEEYAHLDPIIILAPTPRCGASLLQRIVNAGGEAIIYGENLYLTEHLPRGVCDVIARHDSKSEVTDLMTERFLYGDRSRDAAALFPDYMRYAESVLRQFYQLLDFYRQESAQYGLNHWGIKTRVRDGRAMENFLSLLPNARVVTIHRDVLDVAKASFVRWPKQFQTAEDFRVLGQRWASNTQLLRRLSVPYMELDFDTLLNHVPICAERLQQHLGIAVDIEFLYAPLLPLHTPDRLGAVLTHDGGYSLPFKSLPTGATEALLLGAGQARRLEEIA
jgi:hypothetical protein